MRKFYLLLFVSFLSITTFSQDIIGNWDFNFILPDTVEVGFDDTYLNQRTFEYKRGD